jgi:cytochrome c biogenesis protein CcmG/thiol:disulfide interchange protein DsbE
MGRFIPILVFALLAGILAFSLTNDPRKMPSTLIDKPVPQIDLPGAGPGVEGLSNANFGGQVVLLNVFSSWCVSCTVEHPTLLALSRNKVVPLYGLDWKDKPGDGMRWLNRHKNPYSRIGDDPSGRTGINLGVTGVPETFVIDRTGRIRYRHAGPVTPDVWEQVFEPLLAQIQKEKG